MGGGDGGSPLPKPPFDEQGGQGHGFRHGGAGPVQPDEGDAQLPQAVGGAGALVQQVPGKNHLEVLGGKLPLFQRDADGLLLEAALRLLPGLLPQGTVLPQSVKGGGQGAFALLLGTHRPIGDHRRGGIQKQGISFPCCHSSPSPKMRP